MQDLSAASQRPWHAETIEAALERCRSSAQGLTSAEAAERLNANGPNRLPAGKPRSLAARIFAQFNNLLIYVLIASAGIAFALGHRLDTVVILGVVLVNATIGFIQEGRAEKALDAIRGMLTRDASVLRDGRRLTVPVESLVVGDVALVEAGDRIPADLRLLRASALRIDEAALTGESVAADKATDPIAPARPARRPRLDGLFRHAGRERPRLRAGHRDRERYRARTHQQHGRGRRTPSPPRFCAR